MEAAQHGGASENGKQSTLRPNVLAYGVMVKKPKDITPRFGIGEWFGFNLTQLSGEERRQLAAEVLKPKKERTPQSCPFQARKTGAVCSKDGGVCSLRLYAYETHPDNGRAVGVPVDGKQGDLRATCPYRFHDELDVFKWVGETILGDPAPLLVGEVGFLEAGASTDSEGGDLPGAPRLSMPAKPSLSTWTTSKICTSQNSA